MARVKQLLDRAFENSRNELFFWCRFATDRVVGGDSQISWPRWGGGFERMFGLIFIAGGAFLLMGCFAVPDMETKERLLMSIPARVVNLFIRPNKFGVRKDFRSLFHSRSYFLQCPRPGRQQIFTECQQHETPRSPLYRRPICGGGQTAVSSPSLKLASVASTAELSSAAQLAEVFFTSATSGIAKLAEVCPSSADSTLKLTARGVHILSGFG